MTDIVIIILVVFLIILAGVSFFLNKKNTISKNDVDFDELSKDLFQRMDNLNTKLEVEQTKLSENLIGSTNSVKEMIKFSEQSQNRAAKEMLNATQKEKKLNTVRFQSSQILLRVR